MTRKQDGGGDVIGGGGGVPEIPADQLWSALSTSPTTAVALVDLDGVIRFANPVSRQIFLGDPEVDVSGRRLEEFFDERWIKERMEILRRVHDEQRQLILRSIRRGRQIESSFHPLEGDHEPPIVLVITRLGEHAHDSEGETIIESRLVDLGPLNVLSRRELEVLALLKHGMSLEKIASTLFRSRKTIENHRASIGRKLGVSTRSELSVIAEWAGLELEDAELERTSDPEPEEVE